MSVAGSHGAAGLRAGVADNANRHRRRARCQRRRNARCRRRRQCRRYRLPATRKMSPTVAPRFDWPMGIARDAALRSKPGKAFGRQRRQIEPLFRLMPEREGQRGSWQQRPSDDSGTCRACRRNCRRGWIGPGRCPACRPPGCRRAWPRRCRPRQGGPSITISSTLSTVGGGRAVGVPLRAQGRAVGVVGRGNQALVFRADLGARAHDPAGKGQDHVGQGAHGEHGGRAASRADVREVHRIRKLPPPTAPGTPVRARTGTRRPSPGCARSAGRRAFWRSASRRRKSAAPCRAPARGAFRPAKAGGAGRGQHALADPVRAAASQFVRADREQQDAMPGRPSGVATAAARRRSRPRSRRRSPRWRSRSS